MLTVHAEGALQLVCEVVFAQREPRLQLADLCICGYEVAQRAALGRDAAYQVRAASGGAAAQTGRWRFAGD